MQNIHSMTFVYTVAIWSSKETSLSKFAYIVCLKSEANSTCNHECDGLAKCDDLKVELRVGKRHQCTPSDTTMTVKVWKEGKGSIILIHESHLEALF